MKIVRPIWQIQLYFFPFISIYKRRNLSYSFCIFFNFFMIISTVIANRKNLSSWFFCVVVAFLHFFHQYYLNIVQFFQGIIWLIVFYCHYHLTSNVFVIKRTSKFCWFVMVFSFKFIYIECGVYRSNSWHVRRPRSWYGPIS